MKAPPPPLRYRAFTENFPVLGEAWQLLRKAGEVGDLDERTRALVKLGIAVGALKEGAVHSAVRKAIACGASRKDIDQVVALAASTIGLPSCVATWSWTMDVKERKGSRRRPR